jgi:hypothetical protein
VIVVDEGNAGWWAQYEITGADFERAWQEHSKVVTVRMGQRQAR